MELLEAGFGAEFGLIRAGFGVGLELFEFGFHRGLLFGIGVGCVRNSFFWGLELGYNLFGA